VLGLFIMVSTVATLWPRGRNAWLLHNRATALADYGACMVGPTGPEIIREGRSGYADLLRLRVITAAGDTQPFVRCSRFSDRLGHAPAHERLHELKASAFREFWDGAEGPSVSQLETSLAALQELADAAWPFVRGKAAHLVQASSHTEEAAHPTAPPEPGVGSGLRDRRFVYRSTAVFGNRVVAAFGSGANLLELVSDDGGVHFSPGRPSEGTELSERCAVDLEGRSFTVTVTDSGERVVLSHGPGAAPHAALLARKEAKLLGVACDGSGLVAALQSAASSDAVTFRLCGFRSGCRELAVPSLGGRQPRYPLDIARIDGVTLIAVANGGLTRVTSSRDQGRTWSPWTVAFDQGSVITDLGATAPFRLLRVGPRVLLYGGAKRADEAYYLLASDDYGASFRQPD